MAFFSGAFGKQVRYSNNSFKLPVDFEEAVSKVFLNANDTDNTDEHGFLYR
jgi:hypothetical protein